MSSNQNSRAKFKQRVAGGAVLLIVLAIFLPFIFNHSHMGANTPVDNTVAPADQAQPTAQVGQNSAADQTQVQTQPQAQNQAADPAAATAAAPVAQTAAPSADATAPQAGTNLQAAQQNTTGSDQAMQSNQPGLTSPQSESAAAPQAQAPAQTQAQAQAASPAATAQPVAAVPEAATQQTAALPAQAAAPAATDTAAPAAVSVAEPKAVHHASLPAPSKTDVKVTAQGHWLVQVGSFTQPEYADQLVSKLRAHGLHAYAKHEPNNLVRVYVGPVASQEQALKIQQKVQEEFELTSLVKQNRA